MNIVEQINDALTTRIATTLGVDFKELNYLLDVEKNNFQANTERYGVRPLSAESSLSIHRHYTMDQEFELVLTTAYGSNPSNDQDQRDQTFYLYDKIDAVIKDVFLSKAALPNIILSIDNVSLDEPDYSVVEKVLVMRVQFNVKYRQLVNC